MQAEPTKSTSTKSLKKMDAKASKKKTKAKTTAKKGSKKLKTVQETDSTSKEERKTDKVEPLVKKQKTGKEEAVRQKEVASSSESVEETLKRQYRAALWAPGSQELPESSATSENSIVVPRSPEHRPAPLFDLDEIRRGSNLHRDDCSSTSQHAGTPLFQFDEFRRMSQPASPSNERVTIGADCKTLLVSARNLSQLLAMAEKQQKVALTVFLAPTNFELPESNVEKGILALNGYMPQGGTDMRLFLKFPTHQEADSMLAMLRLLAEAVQHRGMEEQASDHERKGVLAVECMAARLSTTTQNGQTVLFAEVLAVKKNEVRPSITFPQRDKSLAEMFEKGKQAELVHTDHATVPLRGSGIAFALMIQYVNLVDRAKDGPTRPGWDIWVRDVYYPGFKPKDGRILRVHAIEKLVGDRAPRPGDVVLVRGAYVDRNDNLNWSANSSSTALRFAGSRAKYFSIISGDRFREELHDKLEEAADVLRANQGNFWRGASQGSRNWGENVF